MSTSSAEDRKYNRYAQNCSEVGIQLVPLAFESFGKFSETITESYRRKESFQEGSEEVSVIPLLIRAQLVIITMTVYEPRCLNGKKS